MAKPHTIASLQPLALFLIFCGSLFLGANQALAQDSAAPVPITEEPNHKIRFDNGLVRLFEILLSPGETTLFHEHRTDGFSVFIRSAQVTLQPQGGEITEGSVAPGLVVFSSTAEGPYTHRVGNSGSGPFHVIAMGLLQPSLESPPAAISRQGGAFETVMENARGRVWRIQLPAGAGTGLYTRPARTVLFAITPGRIRQQDGAGDTRLWDFEPGHFQWFDSREKVSLMNPGPETIELIEIEIF